MEAEPEADAAPEAEGDAEGDREGMEVGEAASVALRRAEAVKLAQGEEELVPRGDAEPRAEGDRVGLPEPVRVGRGDLEGVGDTAPDTDTDTDGVSESVAPVAELVEEGEGVVLLLPLSEPVTDPVPDAEALTATTVPVLPSVAVPVIAALVEPFVEGVGVGDTLKEAVGQPVPEAVPVWGASLGEEEAEGAAERDSERDGGAERVAETQGVEELEPPAREGVDEGVRDGVGEPSGDGELLLDSDTVLVGAVEAVLVLLAVGELVCVLDKLLERETPGEGVDLPDAVALGETDCEPVVLGLREPDTVAQLDPEAEGEGLEERDLCGEAEADTVGEAEPVAVMGGEREAEPVPVSDSVTRPVPEGVAEVEGKEAERAALRETLGESDPLALTVGEEVAKGEAVMDGDTPLEAELLLLPVPGRLREAEREVTAVGEAQLEGEPVPVGWSGLCEAVGEAMGELDAEGECDAVRVSGALREGELDTQTVALGVGVPPAAPAPEVTEGASVGEAEMVAESVAEGARVGEPAMVGLPLPPVPNTVGDTEGEEDWVGLTWGETDTLGEAPVGVEVPAAPPPPLVRLMVPVARAEALEEPEPLTEGVALGEAVTSGVRVPLREPLPLPLTEGEPVPRPEAEGEPESDRVRGVALPAPPPLVPLAGSEGTAGREPCCVTEPVTQAEVVAEALAVAQVEAVRLAEPLSVGELEAVGAPPEPVGAAEAEAAVEADAWGECDAVLLGVPLPVARALPLTVAEGVGRPPVGEVVELLVGRGGSEAQAVAEGETEGVRLAEPAPVGVPVGVARGERVGSGEWLTLGQGDGVAEGAGEAEPLTEPVAVPGWGGEGVPGAGEPLGVWERVGTGEALSRGEEEALALGVPVAVGGAVALRVAEAVPCAPEGEAGELGLAVGGGEALGEGETVPAGAVPERVGEEVPQRDAVGGGEGLALMVPLKEALAVAEGEDRREAVGLTEPEGVGGDEAEPPPPPPPLLALDTREGEACCEGLPDTDAVPEPQKEPLRVPRPLLVCAAVAVGSPAVGVAVAAPLREGRGETETVGELELAPVAVTVPVTQLLKEAVAGRLCEGSADPLAEGVPVSLPVGQLVGLCWELPLTEAVGETVGVSETPPVAEKVAEGVAGGEGVALAEPLPLLLRAMEPVREGETLTLLEAVGVSCRERVPPGPPALPLTELEGDVVVVELALGLVDKEGVARPERLTLGEPERAALREGVRQEVDEPDSTTVALGEPELELTTEDEGGRDVVTLWVREAAGVAEPKGLSVATAETEALSELLYVPKGEALVRGEPEAEAPFTEGVAATVLLPEVQ